MDVKLFEIITFSFFLSLLQTFNREAIPSFYVVCENGSNSQCRHPTEPAQMLRFSYNVHGRSLRVYKTVLWAMSSITHPTSPPPKYTMSFAASSNNFHLHHGHKLVAECRKV